MKKRFLWLSVLPVLLTFGCAATLEVEPKSAGTTPSTSVAPTSTTSVVSPVASIGDGEQVTFENSKLLVQGNVGDGATITIDCPQNSLSISGTAASVTQSNDEIIIQGTASVTINGKVYTAEDSPINLQEAQAECGVEVVGAVGDNVTINSDGFILLHGTTGNGLNAVAGNSFTGTRFGGGTHIEAGNSLEIQSTQNESVLKAGNDITAGQIGSFSIVEAGNGVEVRWISTGADVTAGNSIEVTCALGGRYKAGNGLIRHGYFEIKPVGDIIIESTDLSVCQ